MYDGRLGRRWNVDPKPSEAVSVYTCFMNNPIWVLDLKGDTTEYYDDKTGDYLGTINDNLRYGIRNDFKKK